MRGSEHVKNSESVQDCLRQSKDKGCTPPAFTVGGACLLIKAPRESRNEEQKREAARNKQPPRPVLPGSRSTTQPAEIHTPRGGDQLQEIHPQGPRESRPDRIPVRPSGKTNRDQAARGEGPRQRKTDQRQEDHQPERYQHRQIYFYMRVNF